MTELNLKFGKYQNKSIEYVIENDINYAKWVFEHPNLYLDENIKNILTNTFKDKNEHYLNFGKYKNKSLSWIKENNPKYIEYLQKNEYVINNLSDLHKALID